MTSVKEVSKSLLQSSASPISNLKLQKLLYYVQGWSLALYERPAFHEQIEAWVHGPVVPAAFYEYRHYRWNPIEVPQGVPDLLPEQAAHIQEVLRNYGDLTAVQLERLSHDENPWIEARGNLDLNAVSRVVISHASMKCYFTERLSA